MSADYNLFLQTEFWKSLRYSKLERNPVCESVGCRSALNLQVHHTVYRESWEDTKIEDLQTLCEKCHAKHHGLRVFVPRGDTHFAKVEVAKINKSHHSVKPRKNFKALTKMPGWP